MESKFGREMEQTEDRSRVEKGEFINFLLENKALEFGRFTLKSGDISPFFVDLGRISSGRALTELGEYLALAVVRRFPDTDLLFGPAYKGIAIATATSVALGRLRSRDVGVCFDRKEPKTHGEQGNFIGRKPVPGDRVLIIDDVVSSGGTKRVARTQMEECFGVTPMGVLVTLNRCRRRDLPSLEGLGLAALVDINDLHDFMANAGDPRAAEVLEFFEG